jgi:hypothetical protein
MMNNSEQKKEMTSIQELKFENRIEEYERIASELEITVDYYLMEFV